MARSPNSEQRVSIEHHGGVLLSAGAGSGKTFVLVEHISYLLNKFVEENQSDDHIQFRTKLRSYLSSIVMMTFTKKAAGELALRLKARVDEEALAHGGWRWDIITECIPILTVSTIHGVCHKLLSSGLIPNFDPEIEVASEVDQWEKVSSLLRRWYEARPDEEKKGDTLKTFIANEKSLTESLVHIFGDPGLRTMWKNLNPTQYASNCLKQFFEDALKLNELESLFFEPINVSDAPGKGKWKDYLEGFNQLISSGPLHTVGDMNSYLDFFASHKGVRKPSAGKVDPFIIDYFEKTKELHSLLKDLDESLNAFVLHREGIYSEWLVLFKKIFDYIDLHYRSIPGVNFSDLEYYVLTALESDEVVDRISKSYCYFIVDEFQDTSYVQYEILSRLVKGDHSKLFCVGDKKQAIYGFRGGELGVFEECSNKIERNLSLVNNYRSKKNVIDCNNQLFEFLFTKGLGFKGDDPFKVEVEYQECPLESDNMGGLNRLSIEVEGGPKDRLSRSEMDYLESEQIFQTICSIKSDSPQESIAILYSKLAPSRYLISRLIREGIGFTAQMKVPLSTDPALGLFKLLVELSLVEEGEELSESFVYATSVIKGYLSYLGIHSEIDVMSSLSQYIEDLPLLGTSESFIRFVHRMGLANSNYSNNYALIQSLSKLAAGNREHLLTLLDNHSDGTYSIDFQAGTNASLVQIMTVHASKGLEFDHVVLGGIHTNGTIRSSRSYFGKEPGSFKWKAKSSQRSPYKSPGYFLEAMIAKRKDFAESKRLFYVAGTRAVNSLYWCDISLNGAGVSYGDQSWIDGIRNWLSVVPGTELSLHIGKRMKRSVTHKEELSESMGGENNKRPLFHMDSMGIAERAEGDFGLGTIAELSVTRLATLVHCPRKFYLKNICKLDGTDLETLDVDSKAIREEKLLSGINEIEFKSSASRGTEIHDFISKSIIECSNATDNQSYHSIVEWVLEQLGSYEKSELLSEVPLKFPFFGHTINGIPDLVIEGESPQIWDFKTGRRKEETEDSYWFQLRAYAYSQYQLGKVSQNKSIKMVLAYVDQKDLVEKIESYQSICDQLFDVWKQTTHFSPKAAHCPSCEYNQICLQAQA